MRYAKRDRARFTSHRDFTRAFERALRRAGVPMAYSSGFSPHPRISYANASPTGAATEAEYLEIGLSERRDPSEVKAALNLALPVGLVVVDVVEAAHGSLAERLTASHWLIELPGVPREVCQRAVGQFLATAEARVSRLTRTGMREFDVRSAVLDLSVREDGVLTLMSAHQVPLVRPDDLVQALGIVVPECRPDQPPRFTRVAQGTWDGSRLTGPFDADEPDATPVA